MRTKLTGWAATAVAVLGATGAAQAEAYPPYFGYSGYFGKPTTYYTAAPDVQQTTTMRHGTQGFGTRTYTTGGPFWCYKPARSLGCGYHVKRYRTKVVRVRG